MENGWRERKALGDRKQTTFVWRLASEAERMFFSYAWILRFISSIIESIFENDYHY
ncbi:BH0302 [Halalkalibacterium halodurans C-125]|uniref:BH0302 protein n=1 Tax=Halalkalibacterium halodurans (strain ATCC BAA-125 / DSM 18197 / FERM 7344 / JCM 9153 / C-125) TaxID=272558 RepID=Q9KG13_HALH5|nr:BH0302 [Halalkalibacterium halodurans C-125]